MFITENTIAGLSGNYTVEAAEGYSGGIGCQFAALEAVQTDFSFLTAFVQSDAREIGMVREGAGDEDIHTMLEGAISDAWNKLKEWVKKIWEKIKGIFKAFIARLEDFMGKNGYAYFEKYKKVLYNGTPITDLKAKYSKVNDTNLNNLLTAMRMGDVLNDAFSGTTVNDDTDQSDLVDEYLEKMLLNNSTDKKSFKKDFHDLCFESESTEDLESGKISEYVKYISDKKSIIEKFEKQRDVIDKGLNKISKTLDKLSSEALKNKINDKADSDEEGTTSRHGLQLGFNKVKKYNGADNKLFAKKLSTKNSTVDQSSIAYAQRRVSAVQSALSSYNSAAMEAGKFAIAQSRRLAGIIVAYKLRHKNEAFAGVEMSDELYTIIGEAAEYEALSAMDDLN